MINQHTGLAAAVIDDYAIEPLVGVDNVLRAVAGEVRHGERDRLIRRLVGLERPVAAAQQDQQVAMGVTDEEVEVAVAIQIGGRQAGGIRSDIVGNRRQEAALAIAEEDTQPLGTENCQIAGAIPIEVANTDHSRVGHGFDGGGVGEPAAAQAGEQIECVRAGVYRKQIDRPAPSEPSDRRARGRVETRDDRTTQAGVDFRKAGAGAIAQGSRKVAVAIVMEDADLAGQFVRDHDVDDPTSGGVDQPNVGDARIDGQGDRWQEARNNE